MAKSIPKLTKSSTLLRSLIIVIMITFSLLFLFNRLISVNRVPFELEFDQRNYTIQTNGCRKGENIYMLVIVGSHPDHVEIRNVIRRTWGNPRLKNYPFKLVFVFGKMTTRERQEQLEIEHRKNGDILEGMFVDSYHNVTMRDMMGMKWAWEHCRQAKFILRADDDIAIDVFKLISTLEKYHSNATDLMACFGIMIHGQVLRNGQYAMSFEDLPYPFYADYCVGWAYVLTPETANKIIKMSSKIKPLWMNDAYLTGTLITALGIKHQQLRLNYTFDTKASLMQSENQTETCQMGPVYQDAKLLLKLQNSYKKLAIRDGFIFENKTRNKL